MAASDRRFNHARPEPPQSPLLKRVFCHHCTPAHARRRKTGLRAWLPLAAERASLWDEAAASSHFRRRGRGLKASLTPLFNLVMKIPTMRSALPSSKRAV